MIKEYIAYLKDNLKRYWFKSKLYGWGWVPVKWQGWLVVARGALVVCCATRAQYAVVGYLFWLPRAACGTHRDRGALGCDSRYDHHLGARLLAGGLAPRALHSLG